MESNARGWLDCGTSCLNKNVCVGFNFKENYRENEINCQLTKTIDHEFERGNPDESGWTFYEAVRERMFVCDECLNGEHMIWDPERRLGCKCPKSGYVGQVCEKCPLALNFHGKDITQYGISRAPSETLESITVSLWMSRQKSHLSNDTEPTLISYATANESNSLLLFFAPMLKFWINDYRYSIDLLLADGYLHHVGVTWESSSGDVKVYKDGALVETLVDIQTGKQIEGGGIWVIGQDQDSLGGGFETSDSFKGLITQVNIWNRILRPDEMKSLECTSFLQGDYLAYSDFNITSATELIKPSCCPLAPISEA